MFTDGFNCLFVFFTKRATRYSKSILLAPRIFKVKALIEQNKYKYFEARENEKKRMKTTTTMKIHQRSRVDKKVWANKCSHSI